MAGPLHEKRERRERQNSSLQKISLPKDTRAHSHTAACMHVPTLIHKSWKKRGWLVRFQHTLQAYRQAYTGTSTCKHHDTCGDVTRASGETSFGRGKMAKLVDRLNALQSWVNAPGWMKPLSDMRLCPDIVLKFSNVARNSVRNSSCQAPRKISEFRESRVHVWKQHVKWCQRPFWTIHMTATHTRTHPFCWMTERDKCEQGREGSVDAEGGLEQRRSLSSSLETIFLWTWIERMNAGIVRWVNFNCHKPPEELIHRHYRDYLS